ncbi:hypothetical protein D3C80_1033320 [compost metagenome]
MSLDSGRLHPGHDEGFVQRRQQNLRLVEPGRDQPGLQRQTGVRLAVRQKHLARHGRPRLQPLHQATGVRMGGIGVHPADARVDAHVVALDAHQPPALQQHSPQRSGRLEAGDQHRRLAPP